MSDLTALSAKPGGSLGKRLTIGLALYLYERQ
jgi:hypothetical protein